MAAALLQIDLVFSRPETTLAVTRGAGRLLLDMGYAPLLEVGLPTSWPWGGGATSSSAR